MPSKLNADWHRKNPMPPRATLDQRVAWHLQHQKKCACREIPRTVQDELQRRASKKQRPSPKRPAAGSARAAKTVDDYIAGFPANIRRILESVRKTIRKAAPNAEESVSYGIAAYRQNGPLVYFAAHTAHIGLYPMTGGVKETFHNELSKYEQGKGTVRFPLDEPMPHALIAKIVKLRLRENLDRAAAKKKR